MKFVRLIVACSALIALGSSYSSPKEVKADETNAYENFFRPTKMDYNNIFSVEKFEDENKNLYELDHANSTNLVKASKYQFVPSKENEKSKNIGGRNYQVSSYCNLKYVYVCYESITPVIIHQSEIFKHNYGVDETKVSLGRGTTDESGIGVGGGIEFDTSVKVLGVTCEFDRSIVGNYEKVFGTEGMQTVTRTIGKDYETGYYFTGAISDAYAIKKVEVTIYHVSAPSEPASKTHAEIPAYNGYYYEFSNERLTDQPKAMFTKISSYRLFKYTDLFDGSSYVEVQ